MMTGAGAGGRRIVVAGAGVTGLTCALALLRAGHRVSVCDAALVGDNASGVAAGMLAPAFETALDAGPEGHFDLLLAARDRWPALAGPLSITLDRSGALARGGAAWTAGLEQALANLGVAMVRTGEGLFTAEDWRLDPTYALAALQIAVELSGGVFRPQAVTGFTPGEAWLADGARLAADLLVAATGTATGLAPEQTVLTPIKGHILRLPIHLAGPVVRGEGVYLCPSEGGLLVGATMEAGLADTEVDPGRVAGLLDAAEALLPGVSAARAEAKVGVRAATPDGLPLVGPSRSAGVMVAAGMRRNGWLLAPLVADMVAAYAAGDDPGPWGESLSARRFDEEREG